ncbi:MAG TPA: transcriptional repressor LexA [Parcubacteria group bacterium]|nr:transcriptional repressor LexA [Parcubacteria group bacterium]
MSDERYSLYRDKILAFYRTNRRMPGYKEIMSLVGFKSKNAVYKLINKLVEDEVVDKDSNGKLTPLKIFGETPLLGLVEAGIPTTVDQDNTESLSLDEYLIGRNKNSTYLLEVKGDSMIDEGIREGDLVLVERRGDPKDGDIVIAEVDGGWTMKYFKKKGNTVYLKPANKNYAPIYPAYDLKIAAIVRGVIRKY